MSRLFFIYGSCLHDYLGLLWSQIAAPAPLGKFIFALHNDPLPHILCYRYGTAVARWAVLCIPLIPLLPYYGGWVFILTFWPGWGFGAAINHFLILILEVKWSLGTYPEGGILGIVYYIILLLELLGWVLAYTGKHLCHLLRLFPFKPKWKCCRDDSLCLLIWRRHLTIVCSNRCPQTLICLLQSAHPEMILIPSCSSTVWFEDKQALILLASKARVHLPWYIIQVVLQGVRTCRIVRREFVL